MSDEVERLARAIHDSDNGCVGWPNCLGVNRYRRLAHAALAAQAAEQPCPATEAEGAIERVRALADELDEDSANADPTSFVAKGWRDAARRIRVTLAAAADGGDLS
jgi:hypothetical protein